MQQRQDDDRAPQNVPLGDGELSLQFRGVDPEVVRDIQEGVSQVVSRYLMVNEISASQGTGPGGASQGSGAMGGGEPEKGLFEKLFPTIYTIYRVFRKPRPATQRAPRRPRPPQQTQVTPDVRTEGQEPAFPPPIATQPPPQQFEDIPSMPVEVAQPPRAEAREAASLGSEPTRPPAQGEHARPAARDVATPGPAAGPALRPGDPLQSRNGTESASEPDDIGIGSAGLELDETTERAREELRGLIGVRAQAAEVRIRAQRALDEAEILQEDAESVMAQARNIFAKAIALEPDGLRSMVNSMRTLEEAIKTERHLRQVTRQQAEEEADWVKQKATDALLNALSAVRKASADVSRELEEAKRISATAESLKEASRDDLKRAQAMMAEAESRMREEARKLLDQPLTSPGTSPREPRPRPRPMPTILPSTSPAHRYPSDGGRRANTGP